MQLKTKQKSKKNKFLNALQAYNFYLFDCITLEKEHNYTI